MWSPILVTLIVLTASPQGPHGESATSNFMAAEGSHSIPHPFKLYTSTAQTLICFTVSGSQMTDTESDKQHFPGETPPVRELEQWLARARPHLLSGNAGFVYAGSQPPSLAKLRDRSTVPESEATRPGATSSDPPTTDHSALARIRAENRRIEAHNYEVQAERAATLVHIRTS